MGTVSVAVPYRDRWYFAEVLAGAVGRIEEAGHTARVHVLPPSPTSTVEAADAIEGDFAAEDSLGGIAAGFKYRPDQSARTLGWRRPLVVIGGSVLGFPTVSIDDVGAGLAATQHLLGLGHRRIVHLAGMLDERMDFFVDGRRARGYATAMQSAGLEPVIVQNPFDPEAVARAARALLERPDRPTAVVAAYDEIAFPVLETARGLGLRVGRDLSVVGIDDHPRSAEEDLTTVRQRPAEIGATAADLLLDGLTGPIGPKQSRLHATALVVRGSTGRPAA